MVLEPLERVQVEVVGRLVEQQQIGIGDDEPRERGAGLLAARQPRRWLGPLVAREPEAAEGGIHPQVERVPPEHVELVLEIGIRRIRDVTGGFERRQLGRHRLEVRRPRANGRAQVGGGHERVVEMRLLGEEADRQPALARHRAAVGLIRAGRDPHERRLARPIRADQPDPVAERDRAGDPVEDRERADLARDVGQPDDRHQSPPGVAAARAAARRVAAARFVRSVRASGGRARGVGPLRRAEPGAALPGIELRPAPAATDRAAGHGPQRQARMLAVGRGQALAPRAEVRRPRPDHDALDRSTTARTWLAGPLVDVEPLLHRSVAIGRRVVVDRRAPSLDSLAEDRSDGLVQPAFVGRPERGRRPQRMEPSPPQRFVGVDVSDPGQERLIEEQRLEASLPSSQTTAEVAERERVGERFGTDPGEHRRTAEVFDELARDGIAAVQPDLAELADVPEMDLAAVGELEHQPNVGILGRAGRDHEQLAGHLQVDRQRGVARQLHDELLGAPAHGQDLAAGDAGVEPDGILRSERAGPVGPCAGDRRADQSRSQVARDGLDLGKLRHRTCSTRQE